MTLPITSPKDTSRISGASSTVASATPQCPDLDNLLKRSDKFQELAEKGSTTRQDMTARAKVILELLKTQDYEGFTAEMNLEPKLAGILITQGHSPRAVTYIEPDKHPEHQALSWHCAGTNLTTPDRMDKNMFKRLLQDLPLDKISAFLLPPEDDTREGLPIISIDATQADQCLPSPFLVGHNQA